MTASFHLQPDQSPERWDNYVLSYEEVFEPLTLAFAQAAIERLGVRPDDRVLDVAAGSGGAAIILARAGARVTAIDASEGMVARIAARAAAAGAQIEARLMDGQHLDFPSATFDGALSVLGVILFPDPVRGLSEMRRVVRPGRRVAVVTWSEPHHYELATTLLEAIASLGVEPNAPPAPPAQLRYAEPARFARLFSDAGFEEASFERISVPLVAPSARWLGDRIGFAPGMEAWISSMGDRSAAVLDAFVELLDRRHGSGPVRLSAVASVGVASAHSPTAPR